MQLDTLTTRNPQAHCSALAALKTLTTASGLWISKSLSYLGLGVSNYYVVAMPYVAMHVPSTCQTIMTLAAINGLNMLILHFSDL